MTKQNTVQSFFVKYKKWFIALLGIQLIPVMLLITLFGGGAIYLYVNNDINFHPYKSYIIKGYYAGHSDGERDQNNVFGNYKYLHATLWSRYRTKTNELQKLVALEREDYLNQFPEAERGIKLAEMRINNIKLPLQLELNKRFKRGIGFYTNYVEQRVKRESFNFDAEYQKALEDEAWKAGYSYGYGEGFSGSNARSGLLSLKG